MHRFFGTVAMITGSSAGIGAAITETLLRNGILVAGLARREDKLQTFKIELEQKGYSERFFPMKCDVTKETEVISTFKWINANVGNISILINNAGVFAPSIFSDVSKNTVDCVLDTNVKGVILCSKEALKYMKKTSTKGHIINLCSIAGQDEMTPLASVGLYSSSKHAVRIISDSMRREMVLEKTGIKVSNLSPGLVESEATVDFIPADPLEYLKAEDVAEACMCILNTPPNVVISELIIRPASEVFPATFNR